MSRFRVSALPFFRDGVVVPFGKLYFGNPNTDPKADDGMGNFTNEKVPYTDPGFTNAAQAQITLDQYGQAPGLFLDGLYSVSLDTQNDVPVFAAAQYGESSDTIIDAATGNPLSDTLAALQSSQLTISAIVDALYPVGHIITTYTNTNPGTAYGVGTWVQVAQGQCLVGVGTGTDANAVNKVFTVDANAGEYSVTLTEGQIPAHAHGYRDRYDYNSPNAGAGVPNAELAPTNYNNSFGGAGGDNNNDTFYYFDSTTDSIGNSEAHENMPPTFGIYVWRRTA